MKLVSVKRNFCIKIIFSFALISNYLCSSSSQMKREESLMEYIRNFFGTSESSFSKLANEYRFKDTQFQFKKPSAAPKDPEPEKKSGPKKNPGKGNKNKNPGKKGKTKNLSKASNNTQTVLEEWFMIQSDEFKYPEKFPPIEIGDGSTARVEADYENWRLNGAYNSLGGKDKPPSEKFFWFRLVNKLLYYSSSKSDMNVLGFIPIQNINSVDSENGPYAVKMNHTYCFKVNDLDNIIWKICGMKKKTTHQWECQIKKLINQEDPSCRKKNNTNIIDRVANQPILIIPIRTRHCNDEWNYQQFGENWECDCKDGKEQSPIDLPCPEDAIDSPVKPLFQYHEAMAISHISTIEGMMKNEEAIKLLYKENCLRIFHNNFGKVVTVDGGEYHAQEIVFHTPSEHQIKGRSYDMEMQIIHFGHSMGDIGKQIILSFLIEKSAGAYNKFFDDIDFFNLPNSISPERELSANLYIPKIFYPAEDSEVPVMKPFSFFTYQGSLTSPPCTENTVVYVASKPIKLGTTAIQLFEESLRIPDMKDMMGNVIMSNQIPKNSRKVQPRNGRPVFYYNSVKYCGAEPEKPPPRRAGHFEKLLKAQTDVFYVKGSQPSGMPGAFLISDKEATSNLTDDTNIS